MKIGTKSLLFGVHQVFWHPITVGRAWRRIYGRWPTVSEWLCIAVHDLGYWGCADIDGPEGKHHPERGAQMALSLVYWYKRVQGNSKLDSIKAGWWAYCLVRGHSKSYCELLGCDTSPLYLPDKVSILFDPFWFYLFRAQITGEITEYKRNSESHFCLRAEAIENKSWLRWYRNRVRLKLNATLSPN
jgi:hypothetical protein